MQNPACSATELSASAADREWLRRAVVLWAVFAVAASVKAVVQPHAHSVYMIFAAAARHWWADLPLYTFYAGLDTYRYTPTFAIALTPLALLPDALGMMLWNLLSIGLLVWATHRFTVEVLPGRWSAHREALLLALVLVGTLRGIWSGQSNALVLALAMLAMVGIRRGQWWRAAVLLTIPVLVKLWPIALVLLLCVFWPRQLIGRTVAALAVGLALPFLTRPAAIVCQQYEQYYYWLTGCLSLVRWGGYRDALTVFEQFGLHPTGWGYQVLQANAALVVLGWCLWQRQQTGRGDRLLVSILAAWSAWQLLFGPGTERLTYGLIAVPATWAVLESFAQRRHRVLAAAAWTLLSLFSMGAFERAAAKLMPVAPALLPSGVVLFLIWLVLNQTAPADRPTEVHFIRVPGAGGSRDGALRTARRSPAAAPFMR